MFYSSLLDSPRMSEVMLVLTYGDTEGALCTLNLRGIVTPRNERATEQHMFSIYTIVAGGSNLYRYFASANRRHTFAGQHCDFASLMCDVATREILVAFWSTI